MVQGLFNLTGAEERLNSAAAKLEVWQEKLHKVCVLAQRFSSCFSTFNRIEQYFKEIYIFKTEI